MKSVWRWPSLQQAQSHRFLRVVLRGRVFGLWYHYLHDEVLLRLDGFSSTPHQPCGFVIE